MLPNDNVSVSVGHLDHVLTVYSSMEHVTWKSPGPMCGWVGRILLPDSCMSVSSWSKVPLLSIWSVVVPLCRPLLLCPSRWHAVHAEGLFLCFCVLYFVRPALYWRYHYAISCHGWLARWIFPSWQPAHRFHVTRIRVLFFMANKLCCCCCCCHRQRC